MFCCGHSIGVYPPYLPFSLPPELARDHPGAPPPPPPSLLPHAAAAAAAAAAMSSLTPGAISYLRPQLVSHSGQLFFLQEKGKMFKARCLVHNSSVILRTKFTNAVWQDKVAEHFLCISAN